MKKLIVTSIALFFIVLGAKSLFAKPKGFDILQVQRNISTSTIKPGGHAPTFWGHDRVDLTRKTEASEEISFVIQRTDDKRKVVLYSPKALLKFSESILLGGFGESSYLVLRGDYKIDVTYIGLPHKEQWRAERSYHYYVLNLPRPGKGTRSSFMLKLCAGDNTWHIPGIIIQD